MVSLKQTVMSTKCWSFISQPFAVNNLNTHSQLDSVTAIERKLVTKFLDILVCSFLIFLQYPGVIGCLCTISLLLLFSALWGIPPSKNPWGRWTLTCCFVSCQQIFISFFLSVAVWRCWKRHWPFSQYDFIFLNHFCWLELAILCFCNIRIYFLNLISSVSTCTFGRFAVVIYITMMFRLFERLDASNWRRVRGDYLFPLWIFPNPLMNQIR